MVPGTVSQRLSSKSTMSAGSHCSSCARALSSAGWCGGCGGFSCSIERKLIGATVEQRVESGAIREPRLEHVQLACVLPFTGHADDKPDLQNPACARILAAAPAPQMRRGPNHLTTCRDWAKALQLSRDACSPHSCTLSSAVCRPPQNTRLQVSARTKQAAVPEALAHLLTAV